MRYAIVSDIHANFAALQAVDQIVQRIRLESSIHYWFLGDVLGYGPDPMECLRWLRYRAQIGERWVPGNHDVEVCRLATSVPHVGATNSNEAAQQSWKRHLELLQLPENESWWEWWRSEIKRAVDDEVRSMVVEEHGSLIAVFVHASIVSSTRRTQYLRPWAQHRTLLQIEMQQLWELYGGKGRTVCFFHGHTHFPVLAQLEVQGVNLVFHSIPYGQAIMLGEGCFAINPGSVGQPRDGDPRAAFALLDADDPSVTFQRVMYDVNTTVRALEAGGYPSKLVNLVSTANGGADLAYYREVYQAPRLHILQVSHDDDSRSQLTTRSHPLQGEES